MEIKKDELVNEIRKLQAGDGQAFERLYQMTSRSAYFTALKIVRNEDDAQDVLQESYMVVLDKINDLKDPAAFMSWFNMIVANQAKQMLRRNNRQVFSESEELPAGPAALLQEAVPAAVAAYSPAEDVEQEELKAQVLALIDELSDEKRTVILLYYYNELTIRQIAESLDINENTVKSRLFYAKRELAKGVQTYEKKHGRLLGVAPAALVFWALREASAAASVTFVKSGASAAVLASVTAAGQSAAAAGGTAASAAAAGSTAAAASGTAAAATGSAAAASGVAAKLIGMTVVQKVIAGAVATAVIGGGAVGVKQAVEHLQPPVQETSLTETVEAAWLETPETAFSRVRTVWTTRAKQTTAAAAEPSATAAPATDAGTQANATAAPPRETAASASAAAATAAQTTAAGTTAARTTKPHTTAPATTKAPATTRAATTAKATTTKPATTARNATQAATTAAPTTTQPTTTQPPTTTTTKKQTATVTITVTQGGSFAETLTVTLEDGEAFTFADAKSAVAAKGYDTTYAEYSGGSLPITAEGGQTYSITIDVE